MQLDLLGIYNFYPSTTLICVSQIEIVTFYSPYASQPYRTTRICTCSFTDTNLSDLCILDWAGKCQFGAGDWIALKVQCPVKYVALNMYAPGQSGNRLFFKSELFLIQVPIQILDSEHHLRRTILLNRKESVFQDSACNDITEELRQNKNMLSSPSK